MPENLSGRSIPLHRLRNRHQKLARIPAVKKLQKRLGRVLEPRNNCTKVLDLALGKKLRELRSVGQQLLGKESHDKSPDGRLLHADETVVLGSRCRF